MTYIVKVRNPIVNEEVMRIETDNESLAFAEAESLSKRHGIASVYDGANVELARFRYGIAEFMQA